MKDCKYKIKLVLFTDDGIGYIENLKKVTKHLLEISDYSKVARYKIHVPKSKVSSFLYSSNEQGEF